MKGFLKTFLTCFLAVCAAGFLGVVVFFWFINGMVSEAVDRSKAVGSDSILFFNLSANIQDAPVSETLEDLVSQLTGPSQPQTYALRDVLTAIDRAANDDRIKVLYLKGSLQPQQFGSGFAALKEVREAILRFKESGKQVIANVTYPTTGDMYVMSAASKIIMNPEGLVMTPGMSRQPIFFTGFLEKYGIGIQITRVGEFKSAVEPFIQRKMSDEAREQELAFLEDQWRDFLSAISDRSGKSIDELQALIDEKGLLVASVAKEQGIVDELGFTDTVIEELQAPLAYVYKDLNDAAIMLSDYIEATRRAVAGKHVAVLYAEGSIVVGEGGDGEIGGDRLAREIRGLHKNDDVAAIVLRVNSPGGSALASEVILHALKNAKVDKPVIVSMGSYAASGGYWISAYADKIFAQSNTLTGSIGVFGMFANFQEIAEEHGFSFDVVKTAKFADVFSPVRPKTEEELAMIQLEVDKVYDGFLQRVSEGRGLDYSAVEAIASGRVWSGEDALERGLVDELGGLQAAIAYAGEQTSLGAYPKVRDYPAPTDFLEELIGAESPGTQALGDSAIGKGIRSLTEQLKMLSSLNDPKGAYALMPFFVEFN